MYASAAGQLCVERQTILDASTDTSVEDFLHDGSQEVPERCNEGSEKCINAQNRFLRSRQGQTLQLPSRQKQLDSYCGDQNRDQSLPSGEVKMGAEDLVKQAESVKAAVQQGSTGYLQQQGQTCQQSCKQMQESSGNNQQSLQATARDPLYQQGQKYGNGGQYQQQQEAGGDSVNHLSAQLRSVLDFSRLPSLEDALSPSGNNFHFTILWPSVNDIKERLSQEPTITQISVFFLTLMLPGSPPLPPSPPPLPLFSRCPFTNQVLWSCPSV